MRVRTFERATSIVLVALLGACSTTGTSDGGKPTVAGTAAPVAAQVAVYRSLFASNASAFQDRAAAYCVGSKVNGKTSDPDPAILEAMRDNPKVKPASACDLGPQGVRVVDRQSGQPALMFDVETASCTSTTDCAIYGGYYEGNLSSQRNLYRARQVNGQWNVTVEEQGPIS